MNEKEIIVETNWAMYSIIEKEDEIYTALKGYGRGCFWTEYTLSNYTSMDEAISDLVKTYGLKE